MADPASDARAHADRPAEAPARVDAGMQAWPELLRLARITIAEQDLDLRYTAVFDQAGVALDGRDLVGRHESEVFSGAVLEQLRALKTKVIASGLSLQDRVAVSDGQQDRWFEISVTPRRDEHGRTIGVLSLAIDLTDDVRARERFRNSETRLAGILGSAMDAIISTGPDRRILLFNPAAERMFGVRAEEAIGTDIERFVPLHLRGTVGPHLRDVNPDPAAGPPLAQGTVGAQRAVRASGEEFPIEASISHTGEGDDHLVTVIVRDRSEHDQLQAQLLQSQKLEGIGRLAGGVAHDFNNLLTVILGYCELLRMRQRTGTELEEINNAARRASQLTRQLLAFSRRQVLQVETLDLNGLIRGLNRMLRRIIGEDVQLQTDLSEDGAWLVADVGQMEQVLLNLVVNARDAMPDGGRLRIATRIVDHAPARPGATAVPSVELSVSDSGVGMSEDVRLRIFEPFFTTKGDAGTGLGLATVYGIVTQTGGEIACSSLPGEGSTFQVWLPLAAPREPIERPVAAGYPVRGDETVLVVEDEALVRELAARSLREYGYKVLEAADVDGALAFADHPGLAIVISDVVMPGRSGDDLFTELARRRPGLPVLLMTGYSEALLKRPVDPIHLLRKPFTPAELIAKIRHLLDRRPQA
ncbi:MAG TPA: ATP-binding protein [Luteitalea sp.]|nr:ATP-binding protein [Luteitalea sp.]